MSDLLELLLLQKECGLLHGTVGAEAEGAAPSGAGGAWCELIPVPLFETIADLRGAR